MKALHEQLEALQRERLARANSEPKLVRVQPPTGALQSPPAIVLQPQLIQPASPKALDLVIQSPPIIKPAPPAPQPTRAAMPSFFTPREPPQTTPMAQSVVMPSPCTSEQSNPAEASVEAVQPLPAQPVESGYTMADGGPESSCITAEKPAAAVQVLFKWSSQASPDAWERTKAAAHEVGIVLRRTDEPDLAELTLEAVDVVLATEGPAYPAWVVNKIAEVCASAVATCWNHVEAAVAEALEDADEEFGDDQIAEVTEEAVWGIHPGARA